MKPRFPMLSRWTLPALLLLVLVAPACGGDEVKDSTTKAADALPESYWLATPPGEASGVSAARATVKDGAELTVVGRIQDYRDKQAQFFLADAALVPCNDRENDSCPTPWDYCCEDRDKLAKGLLTVELREEDGKRLRKTSLAGFHGFDRLAKAVVRGTARVDEAGNVVLVASGLHVSPWN